MDKKLREYVQGLMPKPTDIPETIEDGYIMSQEAFDLIKEAQANLGPEPDVRPEPGGAGPNPAWVKWYCIKHLVEEWEAIHVGNMKIDFDGDPEYITLELKPRDPELCLVSRTPKLK